MAKETASRLSEAELYAPDLDEGILDVERYPLPDSSAITDPYLKRVWAAARQELTAGAGDDPATIREADDAHGS